VLQESFISIWNHAGSYVAAKSQPFTWLTTSCATDAWISCGIVSWMR
jgi:DNA-directed RNA polymerase specialized sigma24 family protein